jgi:predicted 2-oxoglutarate/Fe(II)-dependent dioxygenase YbiX
MYAVPLVPGNHAPLFIARSSNNPQFRLESAAGRHLFLIFIGSAGNEAGRRILRALEPYRPLLNDVDMALFLVSSDPDDEQRGRLVQQLPGIRIFWDFDRDIARLYGADVARGGMGFLLSPRLQVTAAIDLADPVPALADLFRHAERQPSLLHQPAQRGHAPVLYVPHVFESNLCRELIESFERGPTYVSGFMRDEGGRTVVVQDSRHKQRRDHELGDPGLLDCLRQCLERRLLPEIQKAMNFNATRIERYIVACYDESGGFFRAHRDNINLGTAHRRFAVTINLNSEDYQGGDLAFPEFGALTYRAATGEAIVFSCSLLHEALPVTRGRRYAFLPFVYDEAAAKIRLANQQFIGGVAN